MSVTEETSLYAGGNGIEIDSNSDPNGILIHSINGDYNMDSFLFTSESVGEGHPGTTTYHSFL